MDKNKAQNRTRDLPEEESYETIYRSKILNKEFNSISELREAEYAFKKAHEKELKEKAEKKEFAEAIEAAHKEYLKAVNDSDRKIKEVVKEERAKVDAAYKVYTTMKNDFINKYGSYHMTYTNVNGKETLTINDLVDHIFDAFPIFKI